jgi:hypothetical protein
MPAHRGPFVAVERAGLVEHAVADPELADVVQQRATPQPAAPFLRQAKGFGNHVGVQRHAAAVPAGVGAFRVDHLAEGGGDVVQVIVVEGNRVFRRVPSRIQVLSSSGEASVSQNASSAATRSNAATRRGSNQVPARLRASASAAARPPSAWNTSTTWASKAMRVQRDRFTGQLGGLALAVEMLVEAVDAGRHALGKAQQARDLGAALATGG